MILILFIVQKKKQKNIAKNRQVKMQQTGFLKNILCYYFQLFFYKQLEKIKTKKTSIFEVFCK